MRLLGAFFLFWLAACAAPPSLTTQIPGAFSAGVAEFEMLWGRPLPPTIIRFAETAGEAGRCEITAGGQRTISLSPSAWENFCPAQRRALLWHELGHCVLGREHTAESNSYMFVASGGTERGLLPCDHYERNWASLDFELFHQGDLK